MGENKDCKIYIGGREFKGISQESLELNYEKNTIETDCEVNTTVGAFHFKAVFTREQWAEYKEICRKAGLIE